MAGIQDSSLESERPAVVAEPRILTPALVVLLGSTPALAGLELMRHMLGLMPSDLRKVSLVYIDTDDPPNAVVGFQKQHKGKFQESSLRIAVPAGISHTRREPQDGEEFLPENLPPQLPADQEPQYKEQHTFIREKVPQYFSNGAGGIRNNGHVAACFHAPAIYSTLDAALSRITRLGNEQDGARAREVQANLVAFLGGGTGSGILADVAVMIRELLANRQFKQRINLFCLLPEPIKGATDSDLKWRRSNATACLLELLAFSQAGAGDPKGYYEKYMRANIHRLSADPIANEVYLIGRASMGDAIDTARIVGLDLFQRIIDASGVGFLEHSKWVDRRTLGETDDQGLPTMFGTSCPLEVRFPVEATATAFAQIAAAELLPLIASFRPKLVTVTETETRTWLRKWRNVARFDANANDPLVVKLPEFRKSEFEKANAANLDILWSRVEKHERAIEARIKEIISNKREEEMRLIAETPRQAGETSLLHDRIEYLQRLQQEYELALDNLREKDVPKVPGRPVQQENKLSRPGLIEQVMRANLAGVVSEAYNDTLRAYASATRYRLLEKLLLDLRRAADEALEFALSWFRNAEADVQAKRLKEAGEGSMAWKGRLDYPHPHQRHIFDLRTLRAQAGHSVAVERLYRWATGGDAALEDNSPLDYSIFLADCIKYISNSASGTGTEQLMDSLDYNARRLPERVVSFFHDHYVRRFQDTNLFELLDKGAPRTQRGQTRARQISDYLLEHLQHMRGLMSSLVAFEAELWHEGSSALDTSVYLGMHTRDGSSQRAILDQTLDDLGTLTDRGQAAVFNTALDPHRLQLSYGQHAISLGTVRDFYLDRNSSMEAYIFHQKEWEKTLGKGNMPVHSSGAAEDMVTHKDALGYGKQLVDRVLRRAYSSAGPGQASARVGAQPKQKTQLSSEDINLP